MAVASEAPRQPDSGAGTVGSPSVSACTVVGAVQTIDDKMGVPHEHGTTRLENLRVLAEHDKTIVTWERSNDFDVGDYVRTPTLALRGGSGPFVQRQFQSSATTCAPYGRVGPLTADEPFVTWGVDGGLAFLVWKGLPGPAHLQTADMVDSRAARRVGTPRQEIQSFVTSRRVALAATSDLGCDSYCECGDAARTALWVYPLGGAKAAKIASIAGSGREASLLVPALAMGDGQGLGAYRDRGALYLVWLDAAGTPQGASLRFDAGDVGAPALAISGSRALVAWARRGKGKDEPYAIKWMSLEHGTKTFPEPETLLTKGSAFAPGVLTDGTEAIFTWMEGDAASKGAVFAARRSLARAGHPSNAVMVSPLDDENARDPEVSGTVDAPVIVYGKFGKARPGGVPRIAYLECRR